MRAMRAFFRHAHRVGIDVLRNAICSRMLVVEPIWVRATKGFCHGYFPIRARCRVDANAAKPSGPNGPGFGFGFGFEECHGHPGHRGPGVAIVLAVGHEWQFGHSGQRDGVGR